MFDHAARLESERHLLKPHQALEQQGRHDHKHRCETRLRDDETVPPQLTRQTEDASAALRQRRQQIRACPARRGRHAEEQTTRNRDE
jgi:hypothetical protein